MISWAMRRPVTIFVAMVAIVLGFGLAITRMPIDIFPKLDLPVIYVCQPYGGMDPAQMEGLIANYYEYHFLYIAGIHHVESKNVQGMAIMKLVYHPGTNMAQAMGETIAYVNRSRAFMPPGTVPPFVMRFDTGSVPVGYLVLSSDTLTLGEIQDKALFAIRPMFASLPGVSAPPPFGGSQRTAVITVNPDKLRTYGVSPENVLTALASSNTIAPSGNIQLGDDYPIVPTNALIRNINDFTDIPVKNGTNQPVYLRDLGVVKDTSDLTTGYALFNGRRAIYILATKRAEASTLSVVQNIKKALPDMKKALPDEINVSFEFDQSIVATDAISGLVNEGVLGALLTGLAVLLFLRDWRSAVVVVINIPLAILAAVVALWLTGQTINLMTLSGLALAIGILVDEATVEIENIHAQLASGLSVATAVRKGNRLTAIPRLLALLCILAVFLPAFAMIGSARGLFVPLALAVGFAMIASYILSNTLVPVLATLLLKPVGHVASKSPPTGWKATHQRFLMKLLLSRSLVVPAYLIVSCVGVWLLSQRLGVDIFPRHDAGEFRLRLRAPDGTHFAKTEQYALDALDLITAEVGAGAIDRSLGYVGMIPSSYPINAVYQWSRGPEEGILRVRLKPGSNIQTARLQETLRQKLAEKMPQVRVSFEPSDIVNDVMSFGAPTPIDVAVIGSNLADDRAFAEKIMAELQKIPGLRDLQYQQSLDYPTVDVAIDRQRAGQAGVQVDEVAKSLMTATSSSRFLLPSYWPDPKSGVGYQVQVEFPREPYASASQLSLLPVKQHGAEQILLRDVANVGSGKMPGQYDRYNMKRQVSIGANVEGADLGSIATAVQKAIKSVGEPPKGVTVATRGQIEPMKEIFDSLRLGLYLSIAAIFLLLAAYFQSVRLSLLAVATLPAALLGSLLCVKLCGSTINIQSSIGAIMAMGVAMANAILLLSFAERRRRGGPTALAAAKDAAVTRLRPIVMTSLAMVFGMLPLALGLGKQGASAAPLGQAVVGGLIAATLASLFILPAIFAIGMKSAPARSASLDPEDADSRCFDPKFATESQAE